MANIPMKSVPPTEAVVSFRTEALNLLNKHAGHLDSSEMLAMAAQLVGQLTAMMDQRVWTSETVMELVVSNLQVGNQSVLNSLNITKGSA